MKEVSYSEARQNLANILSTVCADNVPVYITRQNGDRAVIISADEYESMDETAFLLSTKANRDMMFEALRQVKAGETTPAKEFFDEFGIKLNI
ncbi:antitoxin [Alphaproteobacteria bacterium]|nr:antitoxin [Alphaproteobacteria bacterium]